MPLEQELKIYKRERKRLLSESEGKFALIKGREVIGVYASQEDALAEGYKRFGNEEFLVKEITEIEQVNFFTRPLVAK